MKKIFTVLCAATLIAGSISSAGFKIQASDSQLTHGCKSAYLIDYDSGECIFKQNEFKRMPIASVCKVMTLTLAMDAVNCGNLSPDSIVTASERAAGMGGSQVF